VRGRVEQLESNYAEILTLLKEKTLASPSVATVDHSGRSDTLLSPSNSVPLDNAGRRGQDEIRPFHSDTQEADARLEEYRRMSSQHFPYVIVPATCTAAALQASRPMLAQAISIVTAWRTPERKNNLRDNFLRDLAHRYFSQSERSLELLQALIVFFGWYAMATNISREH
jgi:hypothetical protein